MMPLLSVDDRFEYLMGISWENHAKLVTPLSMELRNKHFAKLARERVHIPFLVLLSPDNRQLFLRHLPPAKQNEVEAKVLLQLSPSEQASPCRAPSI